MLQLNANNEFYSKTFLAVNIDSYFVFLQSLFPLLFRFVKMYSGGGFIGDTYSGGYEPNGITYYDPGDFDDYYDQEIDEFLLDPAWEKQQKKVSMTNFGTTMREWSLENNQVL